MRPLVLAALLAASAACGTDPSPGDDVGPDAVSGPPVTIDVLPMCQDYTRLVRNADGSQSRSTFRYALVVNIAPGTLYSVAHCGQTRSSMPIPVPCPVGSTCTGSVAPAGADCAEVYRSGNFIDGKLSVLCGWKVEAFGASGALTSSEEYRYASIRVTVY